jgi:GNAT superfamily N-acetyltransferase
VAAPGKWRIEPLAKRHERAGFRCGSQELDRYLRQQAGQDAKKHVAAPFVLTDPPSPDVLGYYTLSASAIDAVDIAPELAKKLPRYPRLPVTLIGRLAVHETLKVHGCGALLLMDALNRSLAHSAEIAAVAVVVDAKDDAAANFYRHHDFRALQSDGRRMYLPMATVAELFG